MLDDLDTRILQTLRAGPTSSTRLAHRLGITRQAAHARLRRLVEAGRVAREGRARATRYRIPLPNGEDHGKPAEPDSTRTWEQRFPLDAIAEDAVFDRMAAEIDAIGRLDPEARGVVAYVVTELVNNAIDHSAGKTVRVAAEPRGSRLLIEIDLEEHVRSLRALFDEYTDDYEFSKTRTVIRLFGIGVRFVSRSEAKRLLHGLERFREVVLDFEGVQGVGQGFADEVFRVWPKAHPEVELSPVHMNEAVEFMVERARRRDG